MSGNHRKITLSNNAFGFYTVTVESSKKGEDIRNIASAIAKELSAKTRWSSLAAEKVVLTLPSGHGFTEQQLQRIISIKINHDCDLLVSGNNPVLEGQLHKLLRKAEHDERTIDTSVFHNGAERVKPKT